MNVTLYFKRLLILIGCAAQAVCQYKFDSWTTDNGLPQNSVWAMVQARDGYLWFTTSDGLVRFDGVRFRVFNSVNTPELTDNVFTPYCLLEDRDGGLWTGTRTGAVRYYNGAFVHYTAQDGLPGNTVLRIDQTAEGAIWIFTDRGLARWDAGRLTRVSMPSGALGAPRSMGVDAPFFGLWRLTTRGWERFAYGQWSQFPLPPGVLNPRTLRIDSIVEDSERRLWYTTFDRPGECYRVIGSRLTVFKGLPYGSVVCYQDRQGYLWVKDHSGRVSLWKDGQLNPLKGFSTPSVFRALIDHEGGLWLGTKNEGLYHVRRQVVTVERRAGGPELNDVHALLTDQTGDLWYGSQGLTRRRAGRFTDFYRPGLPWEITNIVWSIYEDRDRSIWAASWDGIARFKDGVLREEAALSKILQGRTNAIHRDVKGDLWFGTEQGLYRVRAGGGVDRYSTSEGLADDQVNRILEDRAATLWIGTNRGLSRLLNGMVVRAGQPLVSAHINALFEDAEGTLWIGAEEGGLIRLQHGKLTRYTTEQGLYTDTISGILEDNQGFLWMSSRLGLFCVRKQQLNAFAQGEAPFITSTHFGKADGLVSLDCTGGGQPSQFKAPDGKLWFATRDGIAVVDPKALQVNVSPPPVAIEECMLDGHAAPCRGVLRIRPNQNNLEIRYTGISFINPEQMRFQYKLEGLDTDWVRAGGRRTAYYSHLPPGDYRFTVSARNSDGVWNTALGSLPITVLQPLYRSWWFEMVAVLFACSLFWLAWRYRIAQLRRAQFAQQAFSRQLIESQESERKRIAAELHDSLGQRLVVIKNLALMFLHGHPADRGPYVQIEEISAEASQALGEVKEISYNLRPYQLDHLGLTKAVQAIVKMAAAASPVAIAAAIDNVDSVFPKDAEISFYRIVQESLNNIVRHSGATTASVTVRRTPDQVVLTISDDGRGFTPGAAHSDSARGGFGLAGISERAQLLGGRALVHSAPGEGATIIVELQVRGL